jgi:hypothetical protein
MFETCYNNNNSPRGSRNILVDGGSRHTSVSRQTFNPEI